MQATVFKAISALKGRLPGQFDKALPDEVKTATIGRKSLDAAMDNRDDFALDDFERLDEAMVELEAVVSTSAYHGMVCGMMIGNNGGPGAGWSSQAMEFIGLAPGTGASNALGLVLELPKEVLDSLEREDFGFQLMLPADSVPLAERAAALAQWCEGFLAGLALAGQDQQHWDDLPAELVEGFDDLVAIAQLGAADDDAERDLVELVEYVRLVVLSAHSELVAKDRTEKPEHAATPLFRGSNKIH